MNIKKILMAITSILMIIVIAFIGKAVYQEYDRTYCPTAIRKYPLALPQYKNVGQIIIKKETEQRDFYTKQLEFVTFDSPEMVISFYTSELQAAGWELEDREGNSVLGFREASALPIYYLTLYVNPTEASTNVEVVFSYQPCIRA